MKQGKVLVCSLYMCYSISRVESTGSSYMACTMVGSIYKGYNGIMSLGWSPLVHCVTCTMVGTLYRGYNVFRVESTSSSCNTCTMVGTLYRLDVL